MTPYHEIDQSSVVVTLFEVKVILVLLYPIKDRENRDKYSSSCSKLLDDVLLFFPEWCRKVWEMVISH